MNKLLRFSRSDVDRLVAGSAPVDPRLAGLAPLVRRLRAAAASAPSDEVTRHFARQAAQLAHPGPRSRHADRPQRAVPSRTGAHTRLVGAMTALVVMLSVSVGVAYAADASALDDPLYGLDIAMENMGIGKGGLPERLSEAGHLIQTGRISQGLTLAAEAIAAEGGPTDTYARRAAESLLSAADAVTASGDTASAAVRAQVAEKLRFMATTDLTGNEFGQAVSDLARGIDPLSGDGSGTTPTTKHTPSTNNGGKSDDPSWGNGKKK